MSADIGERYAALIGREPVPGEIVRWQTVESDAWALDVSAGTRFVSGSVRTGGAGHPLVRVRALESQLDPGPNSMMRCVAPESGRPSSACGAATWVAALSEPVAR